MKAWNIVGVISAIIYTIYVIKLISINFHFSDFFSGYFLLESVIWMIVVIPLLKLSLQKENKKLLEE